MQCEHCNSLNRETARYCKRCGHELQQKQASNGQVLIDPDFGKLAGLDELKASIQKQITAFRNMKAAGISYNRRNLYTLLIGNPGTGKTEIARVLAGIYFKNGITTQAELTEVSGANFEDHVRDFSSLISKAHGSILYFDNMHQALPSGYTAGQASSLDKLYAELEKGDGDPIVIMSARPDRFKDYVNGSPDLVNLFPLKFYLPDMNISQMQQMADWFFGNRNFSFENTAREKLEKRLLYLSRNQLNPDITARYGRNGSLVIREMNNILNEHFSGPGYHLSTNKILPDDIKGELFVPKTATQVLEEMNDFVGIDGIKQFLKKMVDLLAVQQKDAGITGRELNMGSHLLLTGNPGTGKTTVARKLGEIFAAAGILPSGHVIETDRSKLVGQYIGETPLLVQKYCDEAMGGVLFVDEAYTLKKDDQDNYGQEAIDTLLKRMEDDRGKFIVIAAGYQKEMQNFINANPGLKSRFKDNAFHLPDYTPEELLEILQIFIKKGGYILQDEAADKAAKYLRELYDRRSRDFGNGRDVRTLYENMLINRANRITNHPETDHSLEIFAEDVPGEEVDLSEQAIGQLLAELNGLTGLEEVKREINEIVDFLEAEKLRDEAGLGKNELSLHCIFTGNPGTGKTTVARILASLFKGLGVISKGHLTEVTDKELVIGYVGQTAPNTNKVIDSVMGGVLFIDEAYTLAADKNGNSFNSEAVNTLLKRMEDDRGKFIVIAAGYSKEMQDFLNSNPGLDSRFSRKIEFKDYKPDELYRILSKMIVSKGLQVEAEADKRILQRVEEIYNMRDKNFANARSIRNEFDNIIRRQSQRLVQAKRKGELADPTLLLSEDILLSASDMENISIDSLLSELNQLTGLGNVKKSIQNLVDLLEAEKMRRGSGARPKALNLHFVFTGNPGTGKTTVARILARIFKGLGILPRGQLIEVTDKDLVAPYQGQTAPLTNKVIDSAMGGVLFIDEAYTLSKGSGNSHPGQEAIDTLMKRMEDDRGKFIVIAAGYSKEMRDFLDSNPGLDSRFTQKIEFADYEPSELLTIMLSLLQGQEMTIGEQASKKLQQYIEEIYRKRDHRFANARTIRNAFDEILQSQSRRIVQAMRQLEETNPYEIAAADIPGQSSTALVSRDDLLSELYSLIGLKKVKDEIQSLISYLEIEKQRSTQGGKSTVLNLHFIFKGRPGTGKTTVARLLARLFQQMGLLTGDQLVEVDRKDLVGQYIGQTAVQTTNVINRAIGGVLFIDEAYTLMPENSQSDFGVEAINTLLKRMEDDKGKFIVIAAGYAGPMDRFLQANEGLSSRFTKEILFDDYNPEELLAIFKYMVEGKQLQLRENTEEAMLEYFTQLYNNRDDSFANGRTVRNVFEKSLQQQASRLTSMRNQGIDISSELNVLAPEDIF